MKKTSEYENPFDDFFFWLTLAGIDFGFFENEKEPIQSTAGKKGQEIIRTAENHNQTNG
jgi:hypothetical protein